VTKQCFKCRAVLPISKFYKHPQMSNGRLGKCKECTKVDVQTNYNRRREQYLAYDRARNRTPERIAKSKAWLKTKAGKACRRIGLMKYRVNNPDKYRAHYMLGNAIRDGRLERKPCEHCGKKADGHHEDYGKPLDVQWLCEKHHKERHKELKAAGVKL